MQKKAGIRPQLPKPALRPRVPSSRIVPISPEKPSQSPISEVKEEEKAPPRRSAQSAERRPPPELEELRQRYSTLLKTTSDEYNEIARLAARVRQLKDENRRLRRREGRASGFQDPTEEELVMAMRISSLDNDDSMDPELQMAIQQSGEQYAALESEQERPMSYEELLAISESLGTVPTGLTKEEIAELPRVRCKGETCTICMAEIKDREEVVKLPHCGHCYHGDCISTWFQGKKTCPMCLAEVL